MPESKVPSDGHYELDAHATARELVSAVHISGGEGNNINSSTQEGPQHGRVIKNVPTGQDSVKDNEDDAEDASDSISLSISLMTESKAQQSLENLDTVIFLLRQVIESRPATHPLRPDTMRDLASALGDRFLYTHQEEDLAESMILRKEILLNLTKDLNESMANVVVRQQDETDTDDTANLAKEMLDDFQKSTPLDDLNTIVFLLQQSIALLPAAHPSRHAALTMLSDGLYARFYHSHNISDLNNAISTLQAERDWKHSDLLYRICSLLAKRFDFTGDTLDLQTALRLMSTNIKETEIVEESTQSLEFAGEFYERFDESGDMDDLNTAIMLFREAVAELLMGSENYIVGVNNLGLALSTRYEQEGQKSDIDEAISLHREALELRHPPHPDQSMSLGNLATALSKRFEQAGEQSDLDEAISLHRRAVELLPPPHPDRSGSVNNLACALWIRFLQGGQTNDLNEAISLHREALKLRLPPHPKRSMSLNNLANALSIRFEQEGQKIDIDEAISLYREALVHRLPHDPNRSNSLDNLANTLFTRFEQGGQKIDLDEAISLHRQALELRHPPHPVRSMSLNNLARALWTRFEQEGQKADLDEAISMNRQALELFLPPHPNRSGSLNNLALALMTRFEEGGQKSDLDEAILLHREALKIRTASHPDRSMSLNNLALALSTRFEQGGMINDLDEAINLHREALAVQIGPHSYRSLSLSNLALALSTRFEHEGQQNHLDEAVSSFLAATQYPFQPPSRVLHIAKAWIYHADKYQHASLIDAYDAALQALPQVAAVSLDVQSRQEALMAGTDGLARDASTHAILSGHLDKAIEFLEAGRSIFWSQVLSLRFPFTKLRDVAPQLANKLQDIASALEVGSHRDMSAQTSDNLKKLTIDQETFQLNRLSEDWAHSIDEARKLKGFEDFLRPSRLSTLQSAASEHPVVILIANEVTSHCLIMTSTVIHHIPLPKLGTPVLERLGYLVQLAVSQLPSSRSTIEQTQGEIIGLIESRAQRPSVRIKNKIGTSDEVFEFVLSFLWDELVKPIITSLELDKSGDIPILQWCPTGHFTFLPIHAAGCYDDERPIECASDFFISSYTPTIGALFDHHSPPLSDTFKMLAVIQSQDLPSTKLELAKIREHVPQSSLFELGISGVPAGVEKVASQLPSSSIVHFACHGIQDPHKPLNSGLKLDDGLLRISRIMKEKIPNGSLAFLCACETAKGDEKLPDEVLSLGASLMFSGFQRVVATMWEMKDEDGPTVADAFYEEIFRGGDGKPASEPDTTKSALALHLAVKKLRSQNVSLRRWVPFIHMGK